MLFTSEERLKRLAWMRNQSEETFGSKLRQQKFLFFYEMFSKINNRDNHLEYLKAYPNGPVFSEVYGDSTYRNTEFTEKIKSFVDFSDIDENISNAALYLVKTFTEREISDLTHNLDLWSCKAKRILNGEKGIGIYDSDITEKDVACFNELYDEYLNLSLQDVEIIELFNKIFIISKENAKKLTYEHQEVIELLSRDQDLENPVYLDIEEGVLLID